MTGEICWGYKLTACLRCTVEPDQQVLCEPKGGFWIVFCKQRVASGGSGGLDLYGLIFLSWLELMRLSSWWIVIYGLFCLEDPWTESCNNPACSWQMHAWVSLSQKESLCSGCLSAGMTFVHQWKLVHRGRGGCSSSIFWEARGRSKYKKEYLVEINHYQISVLFIKYFFSLWKKSIIEILIKMLQQWHLQGRRRKGSVCEVVVGSSGGGVEDRGGRAPAVLRRAGSPTSI